MYIYQPFKLRDERGAIAVTTDSDRHLRDRILAILFTSPGERVNNPRFGVGLNRMVFEQLDDLTVAAVEFRIGEGLRRELANEVTITSIDVQVGDGDGQLIVAIGYLRRADQAARLMEILL